MSNLNQWEHLKNMLKPHTRKMCVIVLLMIIISGLNILVPFYQQKIVDDGILNNNLYLVIQLLLCIIVIFLISGIITVIQNYLQADISLKVSQKLEVSIFEHALKLKYSYIQENGIYKIVKDVDRYVQSIMDLTGGRTIQIFVELFKFVGILIALLILNWKITLYLLSIIPLRILLTKILSDCVKKNSEKSCLIQRFIHSWEDDIYNNFLQVKLWNLIEFKTKEYKRPLEERNKKVKNHFLITGIDSAIGNNFMQIIINSLYLLCGFFVIDSDMTVGTMFAFVSYSVYLLQPISLISYLKIIISKVKPEFEIYKNFISLDEEAEKIQSNKFPENDKITMSFKDISFKYDEKFIIKDFNLELQTGDIVAVIGENGSGKSTFINLILRLYAPCGGEIFINDISIETIDIYSYREHICTVLQSDDLFKGTIEENITVYKKNDLPQDLLKRTLFNFIYKYENGIHTKIESKSSGVSGGEKQKIALLRSISKSGRILLLDEPTSNYDQGSEEEFNRLIRELKYDIIIIVTHSEKILNVANKVIELERNN